MSRKKIDIDNPYAGIDTCETHPDRMDEACLTCRREFDGKNNVLSRLSEEAKEECQSLALLGAPMPDEFLTNLRLETLVEFLLVERRRLDYEVEVARRVLISTEGMRKKVTSNKIVAPNANKGLIVPGAR